MPKRGALRKSTSQEIHLRGQTGRGQTSNHSQKSEDQRNKMMRNYEPQLNRVFAEAYTDRMPFSGASQTVLPEKADRVLKFAPNKGKSCGNELSGKESEYSILTGKPLGTRLRPVFDILTCRDGFGRKRPTPVGKSGEFSHRYFSRAL